MDGDEVRWRPLSVLWLMLIVLGTFFFVLNVFQVNSYDIRPVIVKNVSYMKEEHEGFLIKTIGCRITKMDPFHHSIMKYVDNKSRPEICNKGLPSLVESDTNHLYILNTSLDAYNISDTSKFGCCYKTFWRLKPAPNEADRKVKYSDNCVNISDYVEVKEEFVKVLCYNDSKEIYKEFFSFIPMKKKAKPKDSLNVLMIGIDSISRLNLIRTMPKTITYLKKISAFEFLGYNKVADNTFPNLVPVLTGLSTKEIEKNCWFNDTHFDQCPFIWKLYEAKNYTTVYAEDAAWMGTFNYMKNGFGNQPTDYYWSVFNYIDEKESGNRHNLNVYRCTGSKMVYKKLIDYTKRFVNKMETENVPYFGFFWGASLSHDYLNYPTIADDDYYNLFEEFYNNGYLEHTALIFMSDHGMRFGGIRSTYQGMMEERLPFLYIVLPKRFINKYPHFKLNLRTNMRRLTTHYDLHETLLDLYNYEKLSNKYFDMQNVSRKAYSLFDKIPATRTCSDAGIDDHWCTCQNSVEINTNKAEVLDAANCAVDYINNMLSKYEDCVNLTLSNVTSARLHSHSEKMKFLAKDYTIIFSTNPSDALFEATVRLNEIRKTYNVIGTISRINLYGSQSHCVSNFQIKLYCYCKDVLDTD